MHTAAEQASSGAYQRRVFGHWLPELERRHFALFDRSICDQSDEAIACGRMAWKIIACCRQASVQWSEQEQGWRLVERRCKQRCCPRCSIIRSRLLAAKMTAVVGTMDSPRFLTLTQRSRSEPLAVSLERLQRRFRSLKKEPGWKQHVQGGFYAIEATFNAQAQAWHVHLHAVCDGSFWSHARLLSLWERVCDEPGGVHLKAVRSRRAVATYVASYVTKSSDLDAYEPEQVCEWAYAMRSVRLCQTFGTCHGAIVTTADAEPPPVTATDWADVYPADLIASAAAAGQDWATSIIDESSSRCGIELVEQMQRWLIAERQRTHQPTLRERVAADAARQLYIAFWNWKVKPP